MRIKTDIFQQEVSRKEFLQYLGLAVLGTIGVTGFLQRLNTSFTPNRQTAQVPASMGYGKSAYGR